MTDHEKFKALLDSVGLTYASLADAIGMKYDSVKNQLAPAKLLPKWAISMLVLSERWEKIKEKNSEDKN
jgi:hypothetical protein